MRENEDAVSCLDFTVAWSRMLLALFATLAFLATAVFGMGQSAQATPVAELTAEEDTSHADETVKPVTLLTGPLGSS